MELKFLEKDTIMDVQGYKGKVDVDNAHHAYLCKFVDVDKDNHIVVSCKELQQRMNDLKDGHVFVFNFFRGAFGYKFNGKLSDHRVIGDEVSIKVITEVEKYSRRKNPRIEISTGLEIFEADGETLIATEQVFDISRGGMSAVGNNSKVVANMHADKEYVLKFTLDGKLFSILSRLVHSGETQKTFSYKYLYAFAFVDFSEHSRLTNAMFNHGLKSR